MKQLAVDYVREVNWDLLPIWFSLGVLGGWIAIMTVFTFHEAGVTQQEIAPLMSILEWVPLFFFVMPFFSAAVGTAVSRVSESGWSL